MKMENNVDDHHEKLLTAELDHPEKLDQVWSAYMDTKNVDFVMKVVSILDWDDRVRGHFELWLSNVSSADLSKCFEQLVEWVFPINYENRTVDSPVDLDLHVALLARNGELKFDDLPIQLPMDDLIHLSMKNAALWSLLAISKDDTQVAEICKREAQIEGGAARVILKKVL